MLKQLALVFFLLLLFGCCYIGVDSKELKNLTDDLEVVNVPASQVWDLYRNLGLAKLSAQKLPNLIQSVQVLKGEGEVGTVIKLTLVPGNSSYTEKFIKIDDKRRVKLLRGLEGDCLAIGCSLQIIQFAIMEKPQKSSIIRSTIFYDVKKEFEAKDPKPSIQLIAAISQAAKEFLEAQNNA